MDEQYHEPSSLTDEELIEANFRAGDLSYQLFPHQLVVYEMYRAFEQRVLAGLNDGPPIFVLDCARRWMKTYLVCLIKGEDCLRRPGSSHTYATAIEQDIGEIIIPIFDLIFEDAPDDCKPAYRTTKNGLNAGFFFPNGSVLKLVGVDKKPKGMRGRWSDGFALTEAAFFAGLVGPVSKILHQFQRRPWACMIMESSAPEDPDHDFDEVFVPDAKRRGAYVFQTIDDNLTLTEEQRRKYYSEAAVISVAEADRELYGKRSRNFDTVVIPEFNADVHVREVDLPKHGRAFTVADPGWRHMFGVVHAIYDFDRALLIIQSSWAKRNAGSHHAAAAIAAREYHLWGKWPHTRMKRIPLESTGDDEGWRDLLRHDEYARLADPLYEMAQIPREQRPDYENYPGRWVRDDIPQHFTYWDSQAHEFRTNPAARSSDTDRQLIVSMDVHYGLEFEGVHKTELRTMVNTARNWHSQGRVVYLPGAGPVIDHVRAGRWAKDRIHFAEHRAHAHFDVLAAEIYLIKLVEQHEQYMPHPPAAIAHRMQAPPSVDVQERLPWHERPGYEQELERRIREAQHRGFESGRMKPYR